MSEPNFYTKKWFEDCLLTIEMKKLKVKMNKPVYIGLSILEISKALMYELKQNIKTMQNYVIWIMTGLLFILKLKDFYEDIVDEVEKRFDT